MSTTLSDHVFASTEPAPPERRSVSGLRPVPTANLDWRQALGGALVALGVIGIVVAWFGISGTLEPGRQMPYLASGGIGGGALIALGVTLLVSFEHARDRAALEEVLQRLDAMEEVVLRSLQAERDVIESHLPAMNGNGAAPRRPLRAER